MIAGLHDLLLERERTQRPLRVGLIGAGTFGDMFLRQAVRVPNSQALPTSDPITRRWCWRGRVRPQGPS